MSDHVKNRMKNIMVKKSFKLTFIFLLFAILLSIRIDGAEGNKSEEQRHKNLKHVLVLNAYHQGFGWTDTQVEGIREGLKSIEDQVEISFEYLDWKRYPNTNNLEQQFELLESKYSNDVIDVVITTDDIAMQFAIDHRDKLFPKVPIVFSGVFEESADKRLEGVTNITGVHEWIDAEGTLEIISKMHPKLEHIYILADNYESSMGVANILTNVLDAQYDEVSYDVLSEVTYEEIYDILENPTENSVAIMALQTRDVEGNIIPVDAFVTKISELSKIPIYSAYDFLLGEGIIGGRLTSGKMQGEVTAEYTKVLLNGGTIESLPIVKRKTVYNGFDYNMLQKYEISSNFIPKDAVFVNEPFAIYESHKREIILIFLIMIILTGTLIIMIVNIGIKRNLQDKLEKEHQQLVEAYKALEINKVNVSKGKEE